jgi:hypothetical protein
MPQTVWFGPHVLDPELAPLMEPETEPLLEPEFAPLVEPDIEPVLEPELAPLVDPDAEPLLEPDVEPLRNPEPEPLLVPLVEPEVEPLRPVDPELAPLLVPEVAPLLEPEPAPLSDPELAPLSEPALAPLDEPELPIDPEPAPLAAPELVPVPESTLLANVKSSPPQRAVITASPSTQSNPETKRRISTLSEAKPRALILPLGAPLSIGHRQFVRAPQRVAPIVRTMTSWSPRGVRVGTTQPSAELDAYRTAHRSGLPSRKPRRGRYCAGRPETG